MIWVKVQHMQKQFRDYYENYINAEMIQEKHLEVKKNLLKQRKIIYNLLIEIEQRYVHCSHITLGNAKNTLLQKMNQIQVLVTLLEHQKVIE